MVDDRIAGQKAHWRVLGQGARPVLALHCSLAHGGAWSALAAQLPELQITAPDLPGYGQSEDPPSPETGHDAATALSIGLLKRLAANGPIDVFGHSFGGTVALRVALARPELIRSLVLIEPVIFAAAAAWPGFVDFRQDYAAQAELVEQDPVAGASAFHADWGAGDAFADLPQRQKDYVLARMKYVTALNPILVDDRAGIAAPGGFEGIEIPSLLIEGAESPEVVGKILDGLQARMPRVTRHSLPGAGHMLPLTHAPEVAAWVRDHLAKV